jgi:hypothetical protein
MSHFAFDFGMRERGLNRAWAQDGAPELRLSNRRPARPPSTTRPPMIAAGYMAKKVSPRPEWLTARTVSDICSVSYCLSKPFCDYIKHWKHNGYWFYDSPGVIEEVARTGSVQLSDHKLFYYEVYEQQFDEDARLWQTFEAEKDFKTDVRPPSHKELLGFDVVSFSVQTSPECSPLSCNNLSESIEVNRHCLLASLSEAKQLLESGAFNDSEPGPFRVFAVYSCAAA